MAPVLAGSEVSVTLAGQAFVVSSGTFEEPRDRYVSSVAMPHPGPTVRSLGLTVASQPCRLAGTLSVDRTLWSTLVGAAGVGLAVLGELLTALVGRLRKGGRLRRFGSRRHSGCWPGQDLPASVAVLHRGGGDHDHQQQPEGVGDQVPLAAGGALTGVEPAGLPSIAALDALRVQHRSGGLRVLAALARTWSRSASWTTSQVPSLRQVVYRERWSTRFDHFADPAQETFEQLREEDESLADAGGGSASVFARFDRACADEPWLMSTFRWSTERLLPGPQLDQEGWLAPSPALIDLLVDPERLPQPYHDWLVRANQAGEVGSDELLGEVVTDLVPLVDHTVQVTFTSVIRQTTYNTPDLRAVPCDQFSLCWTNDDPPGDFRWLAQDLVVDVEAWIPIVDQLPAPTPGPTATPSPRPSPEPAEDEDEELEREPVAATEVVIEDWNYHTGNRDGQPC